MALALPEGPRGRALALGLGAIVLAGLWLAAGQPLLDAYADRADELERRAALATRMADLSASLPELQREAAAQSTDTTPASATLEGASDALAGAALQSLVESIVQRGPALEPGPVPGTYSADTNTTTAAARSA